MKRRNEVEREGGKGGEAGAERSAADAPPAPLRGRPGRRGVEERVRAVLDLFAGKASVDQLAARFGVRPSTVEGWREIALESLSNSMRQSSGRTRREIELEKKLKRLERAFTDMAIQKELIENALAQRPFLRGRSGR